MDLVFGIVFAIFVIALFVLTYRRMPASARKAANWPETEGTIQSVNRVVVQEQYSSYVFDVGDFSYKVNDEFYPGR